MRMYDHRAPISEVDIATDAFAHDAAAGYARMRQQGPVVWQAPSRGFLLTGYADTAAALRHRDIRAADLSLAWHALSRKLGRDYSSALRLFSFMPFVMDGTRHLQIRRAMAVAVAPFAGGHPSFGAQIERKLEKARRDGGFDLVTDFASHLLFDIICDLMEIPQDERSLLRPIATMSWVFEATTTIRDRDESTRQISECIRYLEGHVEKQVEKSNQGFIGSCYNALPPDEENKVGAVATMACVMLVMGNNALSTCIVGGVERLKTEPRHVVPQAAWETISDDAIRYVAPVDFLNRFAMKDMIFSGCPIKTDERIILSPLSANRDPAEFGDQVDSITVKPGKNVGLTFGAGSHICVGNRFSRTVIRMAFAALASLPELRLAGEATKDIGRVVRTFASLPVQLQ